MNFDNLILTAGTDPGDANKLYAYPNPASEKLTIDFAFNTSQQVDLNIYSAYGQQVFTQQITAASGETTIDVSGFPEGIYFIHATTERQKIYERKIIISK